MAVCAACGREQVQSSAFCTYCGAVLDRPASAEPAGDASAEPASPSSSAAASAPPVQNHASAITHDVGDVGTYMVRRLLALAVDIVFVGALIAVALRAWLTISAPNGALTVRSFFELVIAVVVATFAYRWLFEGIAGTTLGKLLFGLVVASSRGGSAGLSRAFVRTLLLPVDLALIGFLVAAVTPHRRRIGDLLAGTVVVNARIGVLAPILGLLLLGAATYAVNSYAGGLSAARHLAQDASKLGPSLLGGPQAPSPAPTSSIVAPVAEPSASKNAPAPSPSPSVSPTPLPPT